MISVRPRAALCLVLIPLLYGSESPSGGRGSTGLVRFQGPPPLSFDELVTAASVDPLPTGIQRKLDTLLDEPFISNEATATGAKPREPVAAGIGPVLRIAEWNINRGENEEQVRLALADRAKFEAALQVGSASPNKLRKIRDELQALQTADVIVLDEVDDGVKRTNYRNVARDLAEALHMNYAYGVEFVELDPIFLGAKKMDAVDLPRQHRSGERFGVNPKRYLGLEGTAILSRYPIRSARISRLPQAYDWYHGEVKAISDLERVRRWSAVTLFDEQIRRQVRRGGRIALIADLAVPESPTGILSVVCPHLEDYAPPSGRRRQMDFLLQAIRTDGNPVVMAGDLNTTGHNGTPVTIKRALLAYVTDYRFWLRQAFYFFVPAPGLGYVVRGANYFKNFHDPTAINIPIFAANHEKHLFSDTRDFRFDDGGTFSFDESSKRSFRHKGRTLADSNQRAWKGFATTFSFARTYHGLVGKYKIDWFFVKPPQARADAKANARLLSPRSGRTLQDLNTALTNRISDHSPIIIELPIASTPSAPVARREP